MRKKVKILIGNLFVFQDKNRQRPLKRVDDEGNVTLGEGGKKRKEPEASEAEEDNVEPPAKRRLISNDANADQAEQIAAAPAPAPIVAPEAMVVAAEDHLQLNELKETDVIRLWAERKEISAVRFAADTRFPNDDEYISVFSKATAIEFEPENNEQVQPFIAAIRSCDSAKLTVVDLLINASKINEDSFVALLDSVEAIESLSFKGIDSQKAKFIAALLASNRTIKNLSLASNNIESEGFDALAVALASNSRLEILDLSENNLESKSTKHLGYSLRKNKTLKILRLRQCRLFGGIYDLFDSLSDNTSLTELDVYFNDCETEGLERLIKALKTNKTLTKLGLGANGLGRLGTETQHMIQKFLKEISTITWLNLESNDIEDEEAESIAEGLAANSTLIYLNLKLNDMAEEGFTAIAKALKKNTTLQTLNVASSDGLMDQECVKHFIKALETNKTIKCLGIEEVADADEEIQELRQILESRGGRLVLGDADSTDDASSE